MSLSVDPLRSHLTVTSAGSDQELAPPPRQCSLILLNWGRHVLLSVHTLRGGGGGRVWRDGDLHAR